jgi:hypothetical protein
MPRCGCAACLPRPFIRMSQRSEVASNGPRSRRDLADRNAGLVVQGKDGVAWKLVEQPLLDHHLAKASSGWAWMSRRIAVSPSWYWSVSGMIGIDRSLLVGCLARRRTLAATTSVV